MATTDHTPTALDRAPRHELWRLFNEWADHDTAAATAQATLCDHLRSFREARGLTLEQVAATSGMSMSMLSRAERGESRLSFSAAYRVLNAFGALAQAPAAHTGGAALAAVEEA